MFDAPNNRESKERSPVRHGPGRIAPLLLLLFLLTGFGVTLATRGRQAGHPRRGFLMVQSIRQMERPAGVIRRFLGLDADAAKGVLRAGIPGLYRRRAEEDRPPSTFESLTNLWLQVTCGVSRAQPVTILAAQLPLLEAMLPRIDAQIAATRRMVTPPKPPEPTPPEGGQAVEPGGQSPGAPMSGDPLVLVLHTHTSEAYVPSSGETHVFNGRGDIVQVGRVLADTLQDTYRVPTVYIDQIHDQYPWHEAYLRSQVTIAEQLRRHPTIRTVIDVHRDGTPGLEHTTIIEGRKVARVMLVIGTDRMGLAHPNWRKNRAFAEKLKARMDELYPGLSLGIIEADARYNQHLSEGAFIAELGSESCTVEEAKATAIYFARVVADVVKQELSAARSNP